MRAFARVLSCSFAVTFALACGTTNEGAPATGTGGAITTGGAGGAAGSTVAGGSGGTTAGSGGAPAAGANTGGSATGGSAGASSAGMPGGGASGVAGEGNAGSGAMAGGGADGVGGAAGAAGMSGSGGAAGAAGSGMAGASGMPLEDLQRAHIELRFGMFIHFGILTYTGEWAEPNLDIDLFNPTNLDAGQWADAAVSAKMKYGVLTTRHHDGFALWDSAVSDFDVGSIPWRNGDGDVVREFVDAFRERGLETGLYYSVWDATQGIGNENTVTGAQIDYVKAQLTELLSNYGPINILIFDGWSWRMGHKAVSYQEIRELVKLIQPNCLMLDHTHFMSPWDADIAAIEEPKGAFAPADNTYPATQGQKIVNGNDWFWAPSSATEDPMSVSDIVDDHLELLEPRWTNFLLNCPPDRTGRMSQNIVDRLAAVGAAWNPNMSRPPLPAQGPQNEFPYTPVSATASSGTAASAIDGINDYGRYTVWQSSGSLPQSVTLDLGSEKPDVGILNYVPRYVANMGPSTNGAITGYSISTSVDGSTFTPATTGTWPSDGKMKVATFGPVAARYVRLEATTANGSSAAATEITVGARR